MTQPPDDAALVARKQAPIGFVGPLKSLYWFMATLTVLSAFHKNWTAMAIVVSALAIIEAMEKIARAALEPSDKGMGR